jgi:Uncharacterized conserved protein
MSRSALVDPVFLVLSLGVLGLLVGLRWRRFGLTIILLAFVGLYALSTECVSSSLLAAIEAQQQRPTAPDPAHPPAAIVVLSGDLRRLPPELGGDIIGEQTLERVRRAVRLHRETGLPILVSGGMVPGARKSLARTMTEALRRDFGTDAAWEEDQSLTTHENAEFSTRILAAAGIHSIYLVTHASHMPRATEAFARRGLHVVPAPTGFTHPVETLSLYSLLPRAAYLAASGRALREFAGLAFYRLAYE